MANPTDAYDAYTVGRLDAVARQSLEDRHPAAEEWPGVYGLDGVGYAEEEGLAYDGVAREGPNVGVGEAVKLGLFAVHLGSRFSSRTPRKVEESTHVFALEA